jgi:hypothetical protein
MHPSNDVKDLCLPGEYKNEEYQIKIGNKSFPMNFSEDIFSKTEPSAQLKQDTCCILCDKTEALTFCDFCGHKACEDCLYKKRKFQVSKSSSTNEISVKTGGICKVCDRKFIMKSAFTQYSAIIDKQDSQIENDCKQFFTIQADGIKKDQQLKALVIEVEKADKNINKASDEL